MRFLLPKVALLIPAAGSGERFGAPIPKALVQLNGRTLIEHALLNLGPVATQIIVAAPAGYEDKFREILGEAVIENVCGRDYRLLLIAPAELNRAKFHLKLANMHDASGKVTGLHMRISGQSILTAVRPEALVKGMDPATFQGVARSGEFEFGYGGISNLLIDHAMRNTHVPPGFWRGDLRPLTRPAPGLGCMWNARGNSGRG